MRYMSLILLLRLNPLDGSLDLKFMTIPHVTTDHLSKSDQGRCHTPNGR